MKKPDRFDRVLCEGKGMRVSLLVSVLALSAVSRVGAVTPVGATASSEAFPALGPSQAIDTSGASFWSSRAWGDSAHVEWIQVELPSTIPLAGVRLTPRTISSATYGFPRDYSIEYSYDASGAHWFSVANASYAGTPTPTGVVTHTFAVEILAKRVRIKATKLSADDFGNYYFQLAEIEAIQGATIFPFETSNGEAYDAQLNMLWSIYGTVSDGTNAVYTLGNEPAYHEWMALKYGWSKSTASLFSTLRNGRIAVWPISNDGYVWSWSNQEQWPGDPVVFHNDNNAKYILAAWRIWAWERSDAWFDRLDNTTVASPAVPPRPGMSDVSAGKTMRQKLRLAMQYLEQSLQGSLGGITIEDNGMNNTGTVAGDPTSYWDNWKLGYKNAYDNVYYYAALEAMAQMEEYWGDSARATQLRAYRVGCKAEYDALFWSPQKGRFICTIDKNGVAWDFGSTFINVEALAYGLGDSGKAQSVFQWLDGRRIIPGETSTGADIYYWAFAPRSNTVAIETVGPPHWWADHNGQINVGNATAGWPNHLENGGAIFYVSAYDVIARLAHLGPDDAVDRFNAILGEFETDQLRRDPAPPGSTAWQLGVIGEFPESGLVPCALVYGFAGLMPDAYGLSIAPRLPTAWTRLKIRRVAWAGTTLTITAMPTEIVIQSDPASTRTVYERHTPIMPGETKSFSISLGTGVRVLLAPALYRGDYDADGDVDGADFGAFAGCFNGAGNPTDPSCFSSDFDGDMDVDGADYGAFAGCFNGSGNPGACGDA